jgi:hypothetical protein
MRIVPSNIAATNYLHSGFPFPLTIVDPNTDLTLWESAAIIRYLEEVYNMEKKLT